MRNYGGFSPTGRKSALTFCTQDFAYYKLSTNIYRLDGIFDTTVSKIT